MGRAGLVAVVALVAALVAGCGDAPTPMFGPPAASSVLPVGPSTSAAVDVEPPVMPELAREHTVAGAKAFVHFVVASMNYSESSLDVAPLRRIFSPGCYVCKAAPRTVADIREHHGTMSGGEISASDERVEWLRVKGFRLAHVTFTYRSSRQVVRVPGRTTKVYPAGSATTSWTLSPRPAGWTVVGWDAG